MNPVAFEFFGISVMWYGVFISTGVLAVILYAAQMLKRFKIYNEDEFFGMVLAIVLAGFVGARLYYVLFNLDYYSSLWQMLNFREGGLAFHGGVLAGIGAILIYAKVKKMDTLRYLDIIGTGTLLAQAIGRWGNFFNQEAHGGKVSEGFINYFPAFIKKGMFIDGVYYHPTFLYESISGVFWFGLLTFLMIKFPGIKKGTFIALALIGNSLTRIFVEELRTDSLMLGDIKIAQLVGVIAIFFCGMYLLYAYFGYKGNGGKKKKKK